MAGKNHDDIGTAPFSLSSNFLKRREICPPRRPAGHADTGQIRRDKHFMDQAIRTIMGLIVRLVAVALFITGLVFAHEFLHNNLNPDRQPYQQHFQQAYLSSSAAQL